MPEDYEPDALRMQLEDIARSRPPQGDRPINVEALIRLIESEGQEVLYSTPGEITETGVYPSTQTTAMLAAPILSGREWEAIARYLLETRKR